jgi:hypothetical protein
MPASNSNSLPYFTCATLYHNLSGIIAVSYFRAVQGVDLGRSLAPWGLGIELWAGSEARGVAREPTRRHVEELVFATRVQEPLFDEHKSTMSSFITHLSPTHCRCSRTLMIYHVETSQGSR